jgi:hypothetical protein
MSDQQNKPKANVNVSGSTIQGGIVGVGGQQTFHGPVKVTLGDLTATINAIPNADQAAKVELEGLLKQLDTELSKADPEEADAIKLRLSQFLSEAKQPQPVAEKLTDKGNKLKKAAEDIAGAMPTVLGIATKIVLTVLKLGLG